MVREPQDVVVFGREKVATVDFRDNQHRSPVFELLVADIGGTQEFDSSHFEIDQVVGVMHAPLPVCLLITNTQFDFVFPQHRRFQQLSGVGGNRLASFALFARIVASQPMQWEPRAPG